MTCLKCLLNFIILLRCSQIIMYCVLIKDATKEDLGIAIFFFCAWQLIYCLCTIWFLRKGNYHDHEELNGWKRYCIVMFVWLGGSITSAIETLDIVYIQGKYFFVTPDEKWITQQGTILGVSTIFWITDIISGLPSIVKLIWSVCCSSSPHRIMINPQETGASYGAEPSAPDEEDEDEDDDDQSITLPENASACVICLIRPANVYLEPCHHLCLCTKDARQLMQQVIRKCPLDNQTIQSTVQVFPS